MVEDSRAVRTFIQGLLAGERDIEVTTAVDGPSGVKRACEEAPDIILMDLHLPGFDGVQAIREIMAREACPIVVLSGNLEVAGRDPTFEALSAGAVEVMAKPAGLGTEDMKQFRERLLWMIRAMREARVVKRKRQPMAPPGPVPDRKPRNESCKLIVIGGSTGAPPVVMELLRAIPVPSPVPVVIGQHIIPGFEASFSTWLGGSGHKTQVVRGEMKLEAGRVYVAPADEDLVISRQQLQTRPRSGNHVPSIDVLFESAARAFGGEVCAFLLSGMGEDGAQGLFNLRRAGALTITQSGPTCSVDGMPRAARKLDAFVHDLPPGEMVELLRSLSSLKPAQPPNGQKLVYGSAPSR